MFLVILMAFHYELFSMDAIESAKMSDIFGGAEETKGGSRTGDLYSGTYISQVTRTPTSDNADGTWNGGKASDDVNVGPIPAQSIIPICGGMPISLPVPSSGVVVINIGSTSGSNKGSLNSID